MKKAIFCLLLTMLTISCGPVITRIGYERPAVMDKKEYSVPIIAAKPTRLHGFEKIAEIRIKNRNFKMFSGCTEDQIRHILQYDAGLIKADLINIVSILFPRRDGECYTVNAGFLKKTADWVDTEEVIAQYHYDFDTEVLDGRRIEAEEDSLVFYSDLVRMTDTSATDSCWSAFVIKKGRQREQRDNMFSFSKNGFYLARGILYEFELDNPHNERFMGKLVDIKKDTLVFINFMNQSVALNSVLEYDTLQLSFEDISKFYLVEDRALGIYSSMNLSNYTIEYARDTISCKAQNMYGPIYYNDSTVYEIAPYFTGIGLIWIYEDAGKTYYFSGVRPKPGTVPVDTTFDRRYPIWFTPCGVEEINGIAFGLLAENLKNFDNQDTLTINGLNIEVNPFKIFSVIGPYTPPYIDSLAIYENHLRGKETTTVNGLNFSVMGNVGLRESNGITLNGFHYMILKSNWISVTGMNSAIYEFNGLAISVLRNKATIGKGLQIGLFNSCKNLKGFQIGLWNTNGKRSLPLINWDF